MYLQLPKSYLDFGRPILKHSLVHVWLNLIIHDNTSNTKCLSQIKGATLFRSSLAIGVFAIWARNMKHAILKLSNLPYNHYFEQYCCWQEQGHGRIFWQEINASKCQFKIVMLRNPIVTFVSIIGIPFILTNF